MRIINKNEFYPNNFNFALTRFGLEVDMETCHDIQLVHRATSAVRQYAKHYVSCGTRPLQWSAAERKEFLDKQRRANAVFDKLEGVCPHVFQPRGLVTEGDGRIFWRNYGNTDTTLQQYESGLVVYRNAYLHSQDISIGPIEALEKSIPDQAAICP
jgi:hypothetical protein